MKIITWNCNGAFRRKFESLLDFNADIYVIQECENPIESEDKNYKSWAKNYLWTGDTKNKGLGIFANQSIVIKQLEWSDEYNGHRVKHFLPCMVNGSIQLVAVWTHKNNSPNFGYIGQFWKYIQVNKSEFANAIIAGDFNSNIIWDEWDRWWNHSDVVNELREKGIESLYHWFSKEAQGKETQPTFYLHRNSKKPYHIDYCFASTGLIDKVKAVEIGAFENWKAFSDHSPLSIEFDL
jgi:exonuclease III